MNYIVDYHKASDGKKGVILFYGGATSLNFEYEKSSRKLTSLSPI